MFDPDAVFYGYVVGFLIGIFVGAVCYLGFRQTLLREINLYKGFNEEMEQLIAKVKARK